MGHLGPLCSKEITITFSAIEPTTLSSIPITCTLRRIAYVTAEDVVGEEIDVSVDSKEKINGKKGEAEKDSEKEKEKERDKDREREQSLWGLWSDSMNSVRPATSADLSLIASAHAAQVTYEKAAADQSSDKSKSKKSRLGRAPRRRHLVLGPESAEGVQMVYEVIEEPACEVIVDSKAQKVVVYCSAVADNAQFTCAGNNESITFLPTYMLQSVRHTITFKNDSNISMPLSWTLRDLKSRPPRPSSASLSRTSARTPLYGSAFPPSYPLSRPFSIIPEAAVVGPNSTAEFGITFHPLDANDFSFLLEGKTCPVSQRSSTEDDAKNLGPGSVNMILNGTAKRPLCHFEVVESQEYLSVRKINIKNENGQFKPIINKDMRVVKTESVGLKSKNILKFFVINTTDDKYDYSWIPMGDPSSFWKCGQCSGTLFPGKRTEILFEYVPEDIQIAESFYKFKLSCDVEQLFLFVGTVTEPRVAFSTSKIDFRSVAVGGIGNTEVVYLQNMEDISLQYSFTRATLSQLEASTGSIIEISPKSGTIFPRSKISISMIFLPKDEGRFNFNLQCDIRSKPMKLNINVKGEGYAVHPIIRINDGQKYNNSNATLLLPSPYLNILDFGAVQINESTMKSVSIFNNGQYNFDYVWNLDQSGSTVFLNKGKMNGNLLAGVTAEHSLTFAPLKEMLLEGSFLGISIAGKHNYNIAAKGVGIQPALRFSSTNFDFGACFVTSPGGSVLVETLTLKITNNDAVNSMSVECGYQKSRALWVDCSPVIICPGVTLDVPLHFSPRETIDYAFSIPFIVNGSVKLKVGVVGKGVNARLDLANIAQKKISFGVSSIGKSSTVVVPLINKSKKAITLQIIDGNTVSTTSTTGGGGGSGGVRGVSLADRCITVLPAGEVIVQPRATLSLEITFSPNKRVGTFSEDLMIKYAGLTRKVLLITGKALGTEYSLDTDSIAFGTVVERSQIVKTLSLFNSGDIPLSFAWDASTFGKHFHILPLAGKVIPGSEATFDVSFRPQHLDSDIRQSDMTLNIAGSAPLLLSCTGCCVVRPAESSKLLQFNSVVRTTEIKSVKIINPTDRDWVITPALQSDHWKVPREVRVSARGSADVAVSYCPLTMCPRPQAVGPVTVTKGAGKLNIINIHYTALHCTALHCTVLYCTVLHCTVLHCTALYSTVLYCTVLYCTAMQCTVLYCTVLYCTVLYCTVLYCTVLYCTELY